MYRIYCCSNLINRRMVFTFVRCGVVSLQYFCELEYNIVNFSKKCHKIALKKPNKPFTQVITNLKHKKAT